MAASGPSGHVLPAAVVLAGGRSIRMGTDKSLLMLSGRPLVAHVLDRLRPQVGEMAISANGDPERFAPFELPVLADTVEGYVGPLAGLLAGMEWAMRIGAAQIVSAPTDSPFIPDDLVVRLLAASEQYPSRPALATSGGRRHPVVGLWPVALAGRLLDFLTSGATYKVSAFADACDAVAVDFPMIALAGRAIDPFFNVNTPDDLAEAGSDPEGAPAMTLRVFGITGWKNSGKTTLTEKLVAELTRRGYRVSTVKHAHHDFDIDKRRRRQLPPPRRRRGRSRGRLRPPLGADARAARRGRAEARATSWRGWRPATSCWSKATSAKATTRSRRAGLTRRTPRRSRRAIRPSARSPRTTRSLARTCRSSRSTTSHDRRLRRCAKPACRRRTGSGDAVHGSRFAVDFSK